MPAVAVEYLWVSGADTHHDLRSKVKTIELEEHAIHKFQKDAGQLYESLPVWNFDGSSTKQALGRDTEILIRPVASFVHPFMKQPAFVTLCECFTPQGQPTPDNTRYIARSVFDHEKARPLKPWYGVEQEYVLWKDGRPYGWPTEGLPAAQGPYYCSNGSSAAFGRKYAETHYQTCLSMGLKLSGMNAEVMPGQWEYQVGPSEAIESGDHCVMARWVMLRVLETEGVNVNFSSKPKDGDWNGSGMHTNFSTEAMRANGGLARIQEAVEKLSKDPLRDVAVYGNDNDRRLSGKHETSRLDEFSWGVGSRCTSIRIPNEVQSNGHGYFEDRRPSASADPYLVTSRLLASACGIPADLLDQYGSTHEPEFVKNLRARREVGSPRTH
jgi:glutamine synthetase